eukprot:scaffold20920_cov67-Phaeocystis_antarctica.AAC.4
MLRRVPASLVPWALREQALPHHPLPLATNPPSLQLCPGARATPLPLQPICRTRTAFPSPHRSLPSTTSTAHLPHAPHLPRAACASPRHRAGGWG